MEIGPITPLYKTRLCNYPSDTCPYGPLCNYAHGEDDLRPAPNFEKTSVCSSFLRDGRCTQPGCRYAHQSAELRVSPVMLKTKMCRFFLNGICVVGEACRFAHSRKELREAKYVQQGRQSNCQERRRLFLGSGHNSGSQQLPAVRDPRPETALPFMPAQHASEPSQQRQLLMLPPQQASVSLLYDFQEQQLELLARISQQLEGGSHLGVPVPPLAGMQGRDALRHAAAQADQSVSSHANTAAVCKGPTKGAHVASRKTSSFSERAVEKTDSVDSGAAVSETRSLDAMESQHEQRRTQDNNSASGSERLVPEVSLDMDVCQDVAITNTDPAMLRALSKGLFVGIGAVLAMLLRRFVKETKEYLACKVGVR